MVGQVRSQDGWLAQEVRASGKNVVERFVGVRSGSRACNALSQWRALECVFETRLLEHAQSVFTHKLRLVRIGVKTAGDNEGGGVMGQPGLDRPGVLSQLRRGDFAFEDVDLGLPLRILGDYVVLELDGVNNDQAGAELNRGAG